MENNHFQQVKDKLTALIRRVQDELPESGSFTPIIEEFINNDPKIYCGNISLVVNRFTYNE